MPDKLNKQGRQMTLRESDGCIVPPKPEVQSGGSKPGNAGVGKAARPSRDSDRTSTVHRDGVSVLTRLDRITQRAKTHRHEVFNNLFSLLTYELLWHAFRRLKRGKVPVMPPSVIGTRSEHRDEESKLDQRPMSLGRIAMACCVILDRLLGKKKWGHPLMLLSASHFSFQVGLRNA